MRPGTSDASGVPYVVHGAARLPKSVVGESPGSLLLELVLDPEDLRVIDIAAMPALPGYLTLLRQVFLGRPFDGLEEAGTLFMERYQGPLVRPTLAALSNALLNRRNQQEATAK
jgi:hypothetical protein